MTAGVTAVDRDLERRRRELLDERAFVLRSLRDLEAEHEAGDISGADYEALHDRYTARAASVLRALEALDAPPGQAETGGDEPAPAAASRTARASASEGDVDASDAPAPSARRRRRRRVLVGGAIGAFALAAVVLVVAEVTARLPGQTSSGNVSLSRAQQIEQSLAQAEVLESEGNGADALTQYRKVLALDPTQEEALAESGWLEYEAGISAKNATAAGRGQSDEEAAERVEPTAYAPHLYLGSMLLAENEPAQAVQQFSSFLADNPPTSVVQSAWRFVVQAYTAAGATPPAPPPGVHG